MNAIDFETRYQRDPDPWGYRDSDYERAKYAATLRACGRGPFASALELGGSIGVFSAQLAPRCRALTTLDFAPTAVRTARRALRRYPHIDVRLGVVPDAIPDGPNDLVVASEILYYLAPAALETTLARLGEVLAGRLVIAHWRPVGAERPHTAAEVHDRVGSLSWLRAVEDRSTDDYLLHALERR